MVHLSILQCQPQVWTFCHGSSVHNSCRWLSCLYRAFEKALLRAALVVHHLGVQLLSREKSDRKMKEGEAFMCSWHLSHHAHFSLLQILPSIGMERIIWSIKFPYGCYHKDIHSGVFELCFSVKSFNLAQIAADSAVFSGYRENSCF